MVHVLNLLQFNGKKLKVKQGMNEEETCGLLNSEVKGNEISFKCLIV